MSHIRKYEPGDELKWTQCRVLSFLDTAYYDSVYNSKEKYSNPSIELVSEQDGMITGLLDIELDAENKKICAKDSKPSGMIWHIAVHPDFRRAGIASELLNNAEQLCREQNIHRIEAWTRDDEWVRDWYLRNGFKINFSYLHINFEYEEMKGLIESKMPGIVPIKMFAHYTGDSNEERDRIKKSFKRVNECVMFEKNI